MARNASSVEINGNRYDATTGRLIGAVKSAVTAIKPGNGQVLDGFSRGPAPAIRANKSNSANQPSRGGFKNTARAVHRRVQNSQTIMRQVVTKPKFKTAPRIDEPVRPTRRTALITSKRAFRAKTILKSPRISRFSPLKSGFSNQANLTQPAAKEGEILARGSQVARTIPANPKALAKPLPSMVTSVSHNQLERMLDHALARADAHKQAVKGRLNNKGPLRRLKRLPRWLSVGIFLVLFLVLGGFFAWQKVPQLSLKVASSRAHIDATVPAYTPYGFSLAGPVKYDDGSVQAELKTSADDSMNITVTQESSNLNSESLAAIAIPKDTPRQTMQVNGSTVYIYGKDNDATWVNKGIKYTIKNKARLSSDELLKIAGSL